MAKNKKCVKCETVLKSSLRGEIAFTCFICDSNWHAKCVESKTDLVQSYEMIVACKNLTFIYSNCEEKKDEFRQSVKSLANLTAMLESNTRKIEEHEKILSVLSAKSVPSKIVNDIVATPHRSYSNVAAIAVNSANVTSSARQNKRRRIIESGSKVCKFEKPPVIILEKENKESDVDLAAKVRKNFDP